MKNSLRCAVAVALVAQAGLLATTASAQFTWTSSTTSVPTYINTLNFDEAPLPAGAPGLVAANAYVSRGVSLVTGWGNPGIIAGPVNNFFPGAVPAGNGNQGWYDNNLELTFSTAQTALSVQFWSNAPTASFSGGGGRITLFSGNTEVGALFINNPHWGTDTTASWFNAVATGSATFDRVVFDAFSSNLDREVAIDNVSWAPTPGAGAALGLGGLMALRRRR